MFSDTKVDKQGSKARRRRVVTLVHGTWACDATWVETSSRLCQRLHQFDADLIVERFRWSGKNSQPARIAAAEALTRQLVATFAKYPKEEHHLIGHSHGGNVVLYALRDPVVCSQVASAICLATPFLHAEARPLQPVMRVLRLLIYSVTLVPIAVLVAALFFFATISVLFYPASPLAMLAESTPLPATLVLAITAGIGCVAVWAAWRIAILLRVWVEFRIRPRIERYQRRVVSEYAHFAPSPVLVLNAQVERDEAAWWLRVVRWASEPQSNVAAMTIPPAALLASGFGGILAWSMRDQRVIGSLVDVAVAGVIVAGTTALVWSASLALGFIMAHLVFIVAPVLIRAHSLGFGEWSLSANWLAAIDARTEPATGYRTESFRIAVTGRGLRHSAIYEDERVIERITRWLESFAR